MENIRLKKIRYKNIYLKYNIISGWIFKVNEFLKSGKHKDITAIDKLAYIETFR